MTVPEKNVLEWAVFAASGVLIGALVSFLVYSHVTGGQRPPSLRIVPGQPVSTAAGFSVPLEIRNEGDVTAESVQIEGTLTVAGEVERSRVEIGMVPHQSRRRAWISFSGDPARGQLSVRAVGYEEP